MGNLNSFNMDERRGYIHSSSYFKNLRPRTKIWFSNFKMFSTISATLLLRKMQFSEIFVENQRFFNVFSLFSKGNALKLSSTPDLAHRLVDEIDYEH